MQVEYLAFARVFSVRNDGVASEEEEKRNQLCLVLRAIVMTCLVYS